ncbi:TetR/AcrR family transcriptional regulator [Paenibacillus azoreducens]|uniref:TetR/AcrR family transcriptional regulator n=1 Tax=Paenibacillus azoreducens TaxID=116718 RepID=UPI0039F5CE09
MENNIKMDRRIKRTRHFIKEALISLIPEKGFDAITIQDITVRADINRSTFYFHYRDKHDLLEQSINEMLAEAVNALQGEQKPPSPATSDYTPIPTFVRMFEHIGSNREFYQVMLKGVPGFGWRVLELIKTQCYEGISALQPNMEQFLVSKDFFITYAAGAHLAVIVSWLDNDLPYTPKYMAEQLAHIMGRGLYNAAGVQLGQQERSSGGT